MRAVLLARFQASQLWAVCFRCVPNGAAPLWRIIATEGTLCSALTGDSGRADEEARAWLTGGGGV